MMFQRISTLQAHDVIAMKKPALIDIRDAGAFKQGHIPGAILLADTDFMALRKRIPRDRPILVYCYHGNASQEAAQVFSDFGYAEVYSLDGGFEAWYAHSGASLSVVASLAEADPLAKWMQEQGFEPGSVDRQSSGGVWPLIKACQLGRSDIVEALIGAGADITVTDAYGNDALWAACYSEDLASIATLLDAGIDLNRPNVAGATGLIYASSSGKTEVVAFLLELGADAGLRTQDDFTALDLAANIEILTLLKPATFHIADA